MVRLDVFWSDAEPAPGRYRFCAFDREMEQARDAGLGVLAVLDYPVAWSRDHARDFATFAGITAARYSPLGIHDYEIWNEPNVGANWWNGHADPVGYTQLLRAASAAIRKADRQAVIVAGALADAPTGSTDLSAVAFLRSMYAHGAKGSFDILSDHPYTFPALPTFSDPGSGFATAAALRGVSRSFHAAVPEWLDEYGAPTGPGGVTQAQQAAEVAKAFTLSRGTPWIKALFVYEWQDNVYDDHFGLIDAAGRPKAAYWSFVRAARSASGR